MNRDDKILSLCRLAITSEALRFGEFTLASGRKSSVYFDGRMLALNPDGAKPIADLFWEIITESDIEAFGGPAVGSVPIVGALVHKASQENSNLKGFFVRARIKRHGTQSLIEGAIQAPMRVMVIEDTVTTGQSLIKAIDTLEENNYKVVRAVALLDRGEKTVEKFENRNIPFSSFLTMELLHSEQERIKKSKSSVQDGRFPEYPHKQSEPAPADSAPAPIYQ